MFAIIVLTCTVLPAQRSRRTPAKEQTEFGSESRIERPVKPPEDVIELLFEAEGESLKHCLEVTGETRTDAAKDLSASEININGDTERDLIVQGMSGCFIGAHNTGWWMFSKVKGRFGARVRPGYYLAFSGRGDSL